MASAYRYRPLHAEKKEIRLVRFDPTSHQAADRPVRCTVEHVSLLDHPDAVYHAISYCWGKDPEPETIILDGCETNVPSSAIAALRGTCRSNHNRAMPVWIDAICINQADLDEKSQQVALMGDIYSRAQQVLIWLGEDDGSTLAARNAMLAVAAECLRLTDNGRDMEVHLASKIDSAARPFPYVLSPLPTRCNWTAFFSLLEVPWFSRLWVIQEVALARKATCYRGDVTIAWHTIKVALRWLAHRASFNPQLQNLFLFNVDNTAGSFGWMNTSWLVNIQARDSLELPLHVVLFAAAARQATLPHDRIYGLLGLLKGSLRDSADMRPLLKPDYRKPIKDLYTKATWVALNTSQSLQFLSNSHTTMSKSKKSSIYKGFPSWVPTLEIVPTSHISPIGSRSTHFCAHADTVPSFSRDDADPDVLKVKGVIVDEIATRHLAFTGVIDPQENASRLVAGDIEYVVNLVANGELPGPPGFLKAVAATLVAGVYGDMGDAEDAPKLVPDFCAFAIASIQTVKLWPQNPLRHLSQERLWGILNVLHSQMIAGGGRKDAFENATLVNPGARTYVRTVDGRLGAASSVSKKGDKVCILLGADVPFVLRKFGARWKIVETAYVYGIMKGEFIRKLEEDGRLEASTVTFSIC